MSYPIHTLKELLKNSVFVAGDTIMYLDNQINITDDMNLQRHIAAILIEFINYIENKGPTVKFTQEEMVFVDSKHLHYTLKITLKDRAISLALIDRAGVSTIITIKNKLFIDS